MRLIKFLRKAIPLAVSFGALVFTAVVLVCSLADKVVVIEPIKAIAAIELFLVAIAIVEIATQVFEFELE